MNHRKTQVGRDLKRLSSPAFHGKEGINQIIQHFIQSQFILRCFFSRKNLSKPSHALERKTLQCFLKNITQLEHLPFHSILTLEHREMQNIIADPSSSKTTHRTFRTFNSLKIYQVKRTEFTMHERRGVSIMLKNTQTSHEIANPYSLIIYQF